MVGVIVGVFCGFAPVFTSTLGVFLKPLSAEFGWGRLEVSIAYGASTLGVALAAPIIGRAMDRFGKGVDPGEALRSIMLWVTAVFILLVSASTIGTSIHLVALLIDRGLDAKAAAFAASVAGGGLLLGRVCAGVLFDYVRATWIGSALFFLGALGLFILWQGTGLQAWLAGSFLMGVALGAEGDLIAFIVRRYFGMKAFGSIYGVLMCAFSLGAMIGPIIMGAYFDRSGTYAPVLASFSAACLVAAVLVLTLGPYRYAAE